MTEAVARVATEAVEEPELNISGIGGTLSGNALAVAAVRATLSHTLRGEDFARMMPRLPEWRAVRDRWDPQRRFRSAQSVRVLGDPA